MECVLDLMDWGSAGAAARVTPRHAERLAMLARANVAAARRLAPGRRSRSVGGCWRAPTPACTPGFGGLNEIHLPPAGELPRVRWQSARPRPELPCALGSDTGTFVQFSILRNSPPAQPCFARHRSCGCAAATMRLRRPPGLAGRAPMGMTGGRCRGSREENLAPFTAAASSSHWPPRLTSWPPKLWAYVARQEPLGRSTCVQDNACCLARPK